MIFIEIIYFIIITIIFSIFGGNFSDFWFFVIMIIITSVDYRVIITIVIDIVCGPSCQAELAVFFPSVGFWSSEFAFAFVSVECDVVVDVFCVGDVDDVVAHEQNWVFEDVDVVFVLVFFEVDGEGAVAVVLAVGVDVVFDDGAGAGEEAARDFDGLGVVVGAVVGFVDEAQLVGDAEEGDCQHQNLFDDRVPQQLVFRVRVEVQVVV